MKLFLDIDGVMVHANPHRTVELEDDGFYKFNESAVQIFNAIGTENMEVILSTSHRFRYQEQEWIGIFKRRGLHFNKINILGIALNHRHSRKYEIETWMQNKNMDVQEIVIIDDDKSLNGLPQELKERLVLTNSYIGLNDINDLKRFFDNI